MRTREDSELVVQGKSLEQEVCTRRLGRPDRSTRPEAASHCLTVPSGDANVNGFCPDGILASHSRLAARLPFW
jgi:hypothetical protein